MILTKLGAILAQINLEGFEEAAQLSTLFAVLVSLCVALFGILLYVFKLYVEGNKEKKTLLEKHATDSKDTQEKNTQKLNEIQERHAQKLDDIRKDTTQKIDDIRKEYMAKEEERNRYQRETEKETLTVLRGVNNVLELSEKMKDNDTMKIIQAVSSLQKVIEDNSK